MIITDIKLDSWPSVTSVHIPASAKVRYILDTRDGTFMYVELDQEDPTMNRNFICFTTDEEFVVPDEYNGKELEYVGSFTSKNLMGVDSKYVYHLYELVE